MTYLALHRRDEMRDVPPFPPVKPLEEGTSSPKFKNGKEPQNVSKPFSEQVRRTLFRDVELRKNVTFGPDVSNIVSRVPSSVLLMEFRRTL